ncbi:MAG: hypothetical protein HY706_18165 [Candidatus Hydrogenedentes bacterium]|nr:hypothetical protein [Candidatus Hydrogenedentota bacterium]
MVNEGGFKPPEKTRMCPSCRMEISVLATKCRFCGENVGRPKDEARQMSIEDLGGETVSHYAPSHSVMEALEAYRTEEILGQTQVEAPKAKTTIFRRKSKTDSEGPETRTASSSGLPELDERSKALASLAVPVNPPAPVIRQPQPTLMKKVGLIGSFVAAVIILYFGAVHVTAMIRGNQPVDTGPKYQNLAPEMLVALNAGQKVDRIKMVQAAADAVNNDPSEENRKIAGQVRTQVLQTIDGYLNAEPWDNSKLADAAKLADKALLIDVNNVVRAKYAEVSSEQHDYHVVVNRVDVSSEPAIALFTVADGTVTSKKGDILNGRFKVLEISKNRVLLEDSRRKTSLGTNRVLELTPGDPKIREIKVAASSPN